MSDSVMRERWRVLKAMEPDVPNSRLKKLDLGPTLDKADLAAKKWHKLEKDATEALRQCQELWEEADRILRHYRNAVFDPDVEDEVAAFQEQVRKIASAFGAQLHTRQAYMAKMKPQRT